jgi:hypothetical protein
MTRSLRCTFGPLDYLVDLLLESEEFWIVWRGHSHSFQVVKTVLEGVQHFRRQSLGLFQTDLSSFSTRFFKKATMSISAFGEQIVDRTVDFRMRALTFSSELFGSCSSRASSPEAAIFCGRGCSSN